MPIVSPSIWQDVLARVRGSRPDLARAWFAELRPVSMDAGTLRVETLNIAQHRHLVDRCASAFDEAAQSATGRLVRVEFDVAAPRGGEAVSTGSVDVNSATRFVDRFRSDMTLDSFVTDAGNRLAFAASAAVARGDATAYNPLVLVGQSEAGKTHLLHAVGNALSRDGSDRTAVLCSVRTLAHEFIAALEDGREEMLREELTLPDTLLVDDFHELAGFPRTQEAFFHVFNARSALGKTLIVASQRDPVELRELPDRIVTRLRSGLVATMDPPTLETRIAVLRRLARERGCDADDQTIEATCRGRGEESAGYASCLESLVDPRGIDRHAPPASEGCVDWQEPSRTVELGDIARAIEARFGVSHDELRTASRHRESVLPRHAAMYLSRRLTSLDADRIGGYFGGRRGASVQRTTRLMERRLVNDAELRRRMETIARDLEASRKHLWQQGGHG